MSFVLSHQQTPENSGFTCNTCGIRFVTAEFQRQHMKTEWHRYNLKRRVAQLATISSEVFAEKVLNKNNEDGKVEDEFGYDVYRRKSRNNTNKQVTRQARVENDEEDEEDSDDSDVRTSRSASPSRSVASELSEFSLGDNHYDSAAETGSELHYTEGSESGFSEEEHTGESVIDSGDEIVSDSDSEHSYVEVALPITNCFYCDENNKETELNIKHMFKKHGLYIPERSFLTDVEGLLWYLSEAISLDHECLVCGFEGKNLESIRQHVQTKGHCKVPYESKDEKLAISEFYNFTEDTPEVKTKGKTVSFASEEETDDSYTLVHVDGTGEKLVLPTGSRIGHRAVARYRRPHTNLPTDGKTSSALVDRRFAPGITSHELTKQEKQTRRIEQRARNRDAMSASTFKGNYRKHFVDEMLQ